MKTVKQRNEELRMRNQNLWKRHAKYRNMHRMITTKALHRSLLVNLLILLLCLFFLLFNNAEWLYGLILLDTISIIVNLIIKFSLSK